MTYTTSLRFEMQLAGSNINTWGDRLDNTLARVDDAIAGFVALTIAGAGDYTVQQATDNASPDEARRAHLKLTGSPGGNFNVIIPPLAKSYWIWNATAKPAGITTGSGAVVTVDPGDTLKCWCDGANVKTTTFGGLSLKDYITSFAASAGAVPNPLGNDGKYLFDVDGVNVIWRQPASTDLSDIAGLKGFITAMSVAL